MELEAGRPPIVRCIFDKHSGQRCLEQIEVSLNQSAAAASLVRRQLSGTTLIVDRPSAPFARGSLFSVAPLFYDGKVL
jgi:hypothetical protein